VISRCGNLQCTLRTFLSADLSKVWLGLNRGRGFQSAVGGDAFFTYQVLADSEQMIGGVYGNVVNQRGLFGTLGREYQPSTGGTCGQCDREYPSNRSQGAR
jgi:hypothetical protein